MDKPLNGDELPVIDVMRYVGFEVESVDDDDGSLTFILRLQSDQDDRTTLWISEYEWAALTAYVNSHLAAAKSMRQRGEPMRPTSATHAPRGHR